MFTKIFQKDIIWLIYGFISLKNIQLFKQICKETKKEIQSIKYSSNHVLIININNIDYLYYNYIFYKYIKHIKIEYDQIFKFYPMVFSFKNLEHLYFKLFNLNDHKYGNQLLNHLLTRNNNLESIKISKSLLINGLLTKNNFKLIKLYFHKFEQFPRLFYKVTYFASINVIRIKCNELFILNYLIFYRQIILVLDITNIKRQKFQNIPLIHLRKIKNVLLNYWFLWTKNIEKDYIKIWIDARIKKLNVKQNKIFEIKAFNLLTNKYCIIWTKNKNQIV